MVDNITIGGITVDIDDPCALYTAIYKIKMTLLSGGNASEVMIADLSTQRRTRFNPADMKSIDAELARLKDLCQQSTGGRKARFAIRAGFRKFPS